MPRRSSGLLHVKISECASNVFFRSGILNHFFLRFAVFHHHNMRSLFFWCFFFGGGRVWFQAKQNTVVHFFPF